MPIGPLNTERLMLREFRPGDAPFVVEMLNEAAFLRHIGDKRVRNEVDARAFIASGPVASYKEHGFGMLHVARTRDDEPVGMCGLLQRDNLPHPDIGFAFLADHCRRGYGLEAARAVIAHGREIGVGRILAVTGLDNLASIGLLASLGFRFDRVIDFFGNFAESNLYYLD